MSTEAIIAVVIVLGWVALVRWRPRGPFDVHRSYPQSPMGRPSATTIGFIQKSGRSLAPGSVTSMAPRRRPHA